MICRICDSTALEVVVDLGLHPWCNHFLKKEELGREPYYPLRVVFCHDCRAAQLDTTVKKEIMFADHTYLSGVTQSLGEHFRKTAIEVDERFFGKVAGRCVLDIGSNDGTQLRHFQTLGYDVLGVESSRTAAGIAAAAGLPTLHEFFNLDCARRIARKFHVINAAGVFFHLEELHSVSEGIRESLRDDGVFVVQFLYMKRIMENLAFDQIYHEHLLYYNLATLDRLLRRHRLELFDAYLAPIHGGQMIGFATHQGRRQPSGRLLELGAAEERDRANEVATYLSFAGRIEGFKADNLAFLHRARKRGKRIWGFGAPVKGNTLLNYFGIGPGLIEYLVERNPLRRGLFAPGSHIPVLIEDEVPGWPDIYYVLAWNFKKEILERNQSLVQKGVLFHFPVNPPE